MVAAWICSCFLPLKYIDIHIEASFPSLISELSGAVVVVREVEISRKDLCKSTFLEMHRCNESTKHGVRFVWVLWLLDLPGFCNLTCASPRGFPLISLYVNSHGSGFLSLGPEVLTAGCEIPAPLRSINPKMKRGESECQHELSFHR